MFQFYKENISNITIIELVCNKMEDRHTVAKRVSEQEQFSARFKFCEVKENEIFSDFIACLKHPGLGCNCYGTIQTKSRNMG